MKITKFTVTVIVFTLAFLSGCGKSDPREMELQKGAAFIRYLINNRDMQQAAKEDGVALSPSVIASFIFSDVGASMWPRSDYFPEGEAPSNVPYPPENVNLTPGVPKKPWTVTVNGDDGSGEITIKSYGDSIKKPVFEDTFKFVPKVK